MSPSDTHGLGYERVDDDPNLAVLLDTMDATARWEATRTLRAWERDHLRLGVGQRLLDVGCGMGDACLALSVDLGPSGEIVGIDASAEMVAVARQRATSATCAVRFSVGDALALDEPAGSFDAVRSERTLQWVSDPQAAVAELARVLGPAGRLSLIDADWSTLRLDVGDDALSAKVDDAYRHERRRPSNVGRRLAGLAEGAGLEVIASTDATHVWTEWDPDHSPAPDGCFSMRSLAGDLVETGHLGPDDAGPFVATIHDAARQGRFSMQLTMFGVVAGSSSTHPPF